MTERKFGVGDRIRFSERYTSTNNIGFVYIVSDIGVSSSGEHFVGVFRENDPRMMRTAYYERFFDLVLPAPVISGMDDAAQEYDEALMAQELLAGKDDPVSSGF